MVSVLTPASNNMFFLRIALSESIKTMWNVCVDISYFSSFFQHRFVRWFAHHFLWKIDPKIGSHFHKPWRQFHLVFPHFFELRIFDAFWPSFGWLLAPLCGLLLSFGLLGAPFCTLWLLFGIILPRGGFILDPFGARRPCFRTPAPEEFPFRNIFMDFRAIQHSFYIDLFIIMQSTHPCKAQGGYIAAGNWDPSDRTYYFWMHSFLMDFTWCWIHGSKKYRCISIYIYWSILAPHVTILLLFEFSKTVGRHLRSLRIFVSCLSYEVP